MAHPFNWCSSLGTPLEALYPLDTFPVEVGSVSFAKSPIRVATLAPSIHPLSYCFSSLFTVRATNCKLITAKFNLNTHSLVLLVMQIK